MDITNQIRLIASTLRNLFKDGSELHGFDAWDTLIGCVASLESLAEIADCNPIKESKEGVDNG